MAGNIDVLLSWPTVRLSDVLRDVSLAEVYIDQSLGVAANLSSDRCSTELSSHFINGKPFLPYFLVLSVTGTVTLECTC